MILTRQVLVMGVMGLLAAGTVVAGGSATAPTTRPATDPAPADATMGWLLDQATTAPAVTAPATRPLGGAASSPFARQSHGFHYRIATITLSDGEKWTAPVATTPEQPVRLWDETRKEYDDIPWRLICSMEVKVVWERQEPQWHFKESGSDIKEYTGKTYPARLTQYAFTLLSGQRITGGVVLPLYIKTAGHEDRLLILHKRDKGRAGQTLKDLVYVKQVEFKKEQGP